MDERDLREGLRTLTAARPPAPAGRAAAAVRRARRIRRTRAAGSALAVAALVVPVVVLASPRPPRPAPVAASLPVHRWPDRSDPSLRAAAERAVANYLRAPGERPEGEARVLWSGRVPGASSVAVAFAFCGRDSCSRAVLAHTDSTRPEADDEATRSSWLTVTRTVTAGVPDAPLAAYLPGLEPSVGAGATNYLLVVAPPEATEVTWRSEPRRTGTGGSGTLPREGTAFAGPIGWVSDLTTVLARTADGAVAAQGIVGEYGEQSSIGRAPWVPVVDDQPGWRISARTTSQLGIDGFGHNHRALRRAYAVFVRCEAFRAVTMTVDGKRATVPCDGEVHRVDAPGPPPAGGAMVELDGDPYTGFSVAWAEPA